MTIRCILFDLDGTLIDSRDDLSTAINLALNDLGLPILPQTTIVGYVGEGVLKLVERALTFSSGAAPDKETLDRAAALFQTHYRDHMLDATVPYAGVREALMQLSDFPKAIVTNKPFAFTEAILKGLHLADFFKAVIGGDSVAERKPSPLPLFAAAEQCGVVPRECLMVGDSRTDILSGRAAQMPTCGFTGGFRGREELVNAGADFIIDAFTELPELVLHNQ